MIEYATGKITPRLFLAIAGLSGLVAACGPAPASPTVTTAPATVTPTPVQPTPNLTIDAPFLPSATPDIPATLVAGGTPQTISSHESPDGRWRADVTSYECTLTAGDEYGYDVLTLSPIPDGVEATPDSMLINCHGLGSYGLEGLFWSANSQYYYYSDSREGGPDGCGFWVGSVKRLEIASMRLDALGGAAISPDQTHLVAWQGQELVVWDANTGESGRAKVTSPAGPGPIAWSPDGDSFVYVQNASYCPLIGPSALVRVDLPDLAQTELFRSNKLGYQTLVWDEPDLLRLTDDTGQVWTYHFSKDSIERVR